MTHSPACPCPWCRVANGGPSVLLAQFGVYRNGSTRSQNSSATVRKTEQRTGLAPSPINGARRRA